MDDRTRAAVVRVARSQIGTLEQPANSNRNPYGAHYHHDGEPWCAYFTSWAFETAGVPLPSLEPWMANGFSYCPDAVSYSVRADEQVDPRAALPGDVVLYDWQHDHVADHVGVVSVGPAGSAYLWAVEGNTSPTTTGSQSNGGGVWERRRPLADVVAVWRPSVNLPLIEEPDMAAQYVIEPSSAVPGLWVKVRGDGNKLTAWFATWDVDVTDDSGNPRGVTNTLVGTSVLDVAAWLDKPLAGWVYMAQDPADPLRFVVSDDHGDYAVRLVPR